MSAPAAKSFPAPDLAPIKRALISVSDKTGVIELAKALTAHHVEILSTGGTAKHLQDAGIPVTAIAEPVTSGKPGLRSRNRGTRDKEQPMTEARPAGAMPTIERVSLGRVCCDSRRRFRSVSVRPIHGGSSLS